VKLLDFGITRMIDRQQPGVGTTLSQRARPMTLAYASPEQVRGEPITTASDVYALGVLLYKLLSGHHPYATSFSSPSEAERTICGEEPTRPSVRFLRDRGDVGTQPTADAGTAAVVAQARRTTVDRLGRELAGDLDAIVLKALRKEPKRRYGSVAHFAEDIQRYEQGLPVVARKGTWRYRASRFVLRNRVAVAVTSALAIMLVALVTMAIHFAMTTATQSRAVAREARTTQQISALLVDMFKTAEPGGGFGDTVKVRTLLDRGVADVAARLSDEPEVGSRLMDVLGQVYSNLGLYDEEIAVRRDALASLRETLGPEHPYVADALEELAWAEHNRRGFEAGASLFQEVLELRRRLDQDSLAMSSALHGLAVSLRDLNQPDTAELLMQQVVAVRRRALGDGHYQTLYARLDLAFALRGVGRLDSAEAVYRSVIPQLRNHGDSGMRILAPALNNLAYLYRVREEHARAEELYREAVGVAEEWGVAPDVIMLLNNMAAVLDLQGKSSEVEATLRRVLAVSENHWPDGHWRVGAANGNLGDFYLAQGDTAAAEPLHRRKVEIYAATLGPDHSWTAFARATLGTCLTHLRRFAEAEQLLLEGYADLRSISGDDNRYTQDTLRRLVALYEAWGKPELAVEYRRSLLPAGAT